MRTTEALEENYLPITLAHAWSAEWNVVRLRRTPPDFILPNRDNTCPNDQQQQRRRRRQQQQQREKRVER